MDTMGSRLDAAMKLRERGVRDLVAAGVMSRANVYLILNDTTRPDAIRAETVDKLCRYLKLSRDWLLTGKGGMDAPQPESQPATLNPDTLYEALALMTFDQDQAGQYPPRAYAKRLADLYERVAGDGGRLSAARTLEFEREVESRQQGGVNGANTRGRTGRGR